MPELSIVIPTYNRASTLRACLDALGRQSVRDFEVVVVVDGSTDETRSMLEEYDAPFALRPVWQENAGQCAALNRGIAEARGEICLIIDDDVVAGPELVTSHLRLQRTAVDAVGVGQLTLELPPGADWLTREFAAGWARHYARLARRAPGFLDAFSGNMSVRRETLRRVGGFATNLTRMFDVELAYRLAESGLHFVYLADAVGAQVYDKDGRAILADAYKEGLSAEALRRRHPSTLPKTDFGRFGQASLVELALRRLLLRLDLPAESLLPLGQGLPQRWRRSFYRFLRVLSFWRGVRHSGLDAETWRRLTDRGAAILMYHAFGSTPSRYVVAPRSFALQMAWLRALRYRPVPLGELARCLREHRPPPARSVAVTIDDGYRDALEIAAPILSRFRVPATLFAVAGTPSDGWSGDELRDRPLLTPGELRALSGQGIAVGSHTCTHRDLTTLDDGSIEPELRESRRKLAEATGTAVDTLAYPFGQRDERAKEGAAGAGYLAACGVHPGLNAASTPIFDLRRIEVKGGYSLARFALALALGRLPGPLR